MHWHSYTKIHCLLLFAFVNSIDRQQQQRKKNESHIERIERERKKKSTQRNGIEHPQTNGHYFFLSCSRARKMLLIIYRRKKNLN